MLPPLLEEAMRRRVYPITRRIAIGQFATVERACLLLDLGFTDVLNVSEAPSIVSSSPLGFCQVIDHPLSDFIRISDNVALACLDRIHQSLSKPDSKLYIHCIACQNRCPTILWLYLVACGMEREAARRLITERCPDAAPGSSMLVDDQLIDLVRRHGKENFLPLHDVAILEAAY